VIDRRPRPTALLALPVLLLAASALLAGPAAAAEPTPPPDSLCRDYPAAATPLRWLLDLQDGSGPLAGSLGLPGLNERAIYCFGRGNLTVTAFVAQPEGLGGTVPYVVSPAWMDTWMSAGTFLAVGDAEAAQGAPAGPFLPVAVPPPLRTRFDALRGRWATVTLHFDDPGATGCRYAEGTVAPGTGDVPSARDLVELCRQSPVISSAVAARCPGRPLTLPVILDTPEEMRAYCFGKRTITFDARGETINLAWLGIGFMSGFRDWRVRDEADRDLYMFVPDTLSLPDRRGTPWENRDGVGGSDVWWHVVGHFSDPAAAECTARDGGGIEGPDFEVAIAREPVEAVAFCRNHFTVDSLVWLKVPPTDAAAAVRPQPAGGGRTVGQMVLAGIGCSAALAVTLYRMRRRRRVR